MTVALRTAALLIWLGIPVFGYAAELTVLPPADGGAIPADAASAVRCDLHSPAFSRCLASAGPYAVRRDPVRPQAVAAVRVTVRNQLTGAVDDATVLAANGREISDTVGNLRFALTVQTAPTGDLTLQFRYDDGHGGSASEALTDAEPHVLSLEHATVTVARL